MADRLAMRYIAGNQEPRRGELEVCNRSFDLSGMMVKSTCCRSMERSARHLVGGARARRRHSTGRWAGSGIADGRGRGLFESDRGTGSRPRCRQ